MIQKTIHENEQSQRFDKYLHKLLPNATGSFLYKMLRKKNITLNGKKADGSEKLIIGDKIELFLSDETFLKFSEKIEVEPYLFAYEKLKRTEKIKIVYEDSEILILNKPSGILSQKAENSDVSVNEWLIGYLLETRKISEADLITFKPSVCNRLDRNTSGMVLCGKTLQGSQKLSELLKDRSLHKFYRCIVEGKMQGEVLLEGYLHKNEKTNKVTIYKEVHEIPGYRSGSDDSQIKEQVLADKIMTKYKPLGIFKSQAGIHTLLEIQLITGKTHQIRAHLASDNHPIIGDYKYGNKKINDKYKEAYGVTDQLLHAYRMEFPSMESPFDSISNQKIVCEMPDLMLNLLKQEV